MFRLDHPGVTVSDMRKQSERQPVSASSVSSPCSPAARDAARRSRARARGVVMVEYALLLVGFGVPVLLGTAAAGIHLIKAYGNIRNDQLHVGP